jgi:Na+-translocating ferredoxin:NAD+ oxidoreductase subunit B
LRRRARAREHRLNDTLTVTSTEALDAILPQTQCTRCGYPDCRAYAKALAEEHAPLNQCPPGGAEGVRRLAHATGRPAIPLNPVHGVEGPRGLAVIDETWCIGCTLCIKACPVDCIVGTSKTMHIVVDADCTGCELCVPACPVDCIQMVSVTGSSTGWAAWSQPQADRARQLYQARQSRVQRAAIEQDERLAKRAQEKLADLAAASRHTDPKVLEQKHAVVQAAIARLQGRRAQQSSTQRAGAPWDEDPS